MTLKLLSRICQQPSPAVVNYYFHFRICEQAGYLRILRNDLQVSGVDLHDSHFLQLGMIRNDLRP